MRENWMNYVNQWLHILKQFFSSLSVQYTHSSRCCRWDCNSPPAPRDCNAHSPSTQHALALWHHACRLAALAGPISDSLIGASSTMSRVACALHGAIIWIDSLALRLVICVVDASGRFMWLAGAQAHMTNLQVLKVHMAIGKRSGGAALFAWCIQSVSAHIVLSNAPPNTTYTLRTSMYCAVNKACCALGPLDASARLRRLHPMRCGLQSLWTIVFRGTSMGASFFCPLAYLLLAETMRELHRRRAPRLSRCGGRGRCVF